MPENAGLFGTAAPPRLPPLKDGPRKGVEGNRSSGAEGPEVRRREEGGCHRQRLPAAALSGASEVP